MYRYICQLHTHKYTLSWGQIQIYNPCQMMWCGLTLPFFKYILYILPGWSDWLMKDSSLQLAHPQLTNKRGPVTEHDVTESSVMKTFYSQWCNWNVKAVCKFNLLHSPRPIKTNDISCACKLECSNSSQHTSTFPTMLPSFLNFTNWKHFNFRDYKQCFGLVEELTAFYAFYTCECFHYKSSLLEKGS